MKIKHYHIDKESVLSSKKYEEGALYFCMDTGRIYADPMGGNARISIGGDPIIIPTEEDKDNILTPIPNRIYFIVSSNNLCIYIDGEWHSVIGSVNPDWLQTDETKQDYIKNKPNKNDAFELALELGLVEPIISSDGSIYTDENGVIYSL